MQDSIGWALLHLSLLSSCQDWPNVSALCAQLSQIPACLACTVHGMLRPTNSPGWLGLREHVKATEYSLGTFNVARGQNQDWFGLLLLPVDLPYVFSNVPTSALKHEWASNMGSNRETSAGSVPSFQMLCHSMLGSVSPRCAPLLCPSLYVCDGARCSMS